MDIEQLKIILEAAQSVGEGATNLTVLWLWLKYGSNAFMFLSGACCVIALVLVITRAVHKSDRDEQFFSEMYEILNLEQKGWMSRSDRRALAQLRIRQIMAAALKKTDQV